MFKKLNKNARTTLSIFGPIAVLLAVLILFQYKSYSENKKRLENQLFRQQELITSLGADRVLDYFKEITWGLDKLAFSVSHHDDPHAYEDMGKAYESLEGKVDKLAYFDASGEKKFVVMGKGNLGDMPQNARFEEFFLTTKNTRVPYISPLTSSGEVEGVYISWPVSDPNSEEFAGVVVARINRESFSRLCKSLNALSKTTSFVNFVYFDQLGQQVCQPSCCRALGLARKDRMGSSISADILTGKDPRDPGAGERFRVVYFPLQIQGYGWHLTSEMSLSGIDGLMRGDLAFLLVSGGFFIITLLAGGFYFRSVYRAKARAESEAAYSATLAAKSEALEAERNKLLAVLNSIPDGIMLIDKNGRVLDANSRMNDIAASAPGAGDGEKGFSLEDIAGPVEGAAEVSIGGKIYKIISVPVNGDGSGSIREVRLVRDITVEKMLDQKKSDIAHMITHDIRNPLSVIIGITQWLGDERAGLDLPDDVKSGIETISRASNRIIMLLDNFLFLMTVEGPGKIQRTSVNLNAFLQKAVLEYSLEAKSKNIRLAQDLSEHLPVVSMDETQMMRAVCNLISNALKYTPGGGEVSVYAKSFRDYVTISVSDNGPGIGKDDLPYIFNRYYRAKRTGKGKKGSGLGLAIVKAVLESHGGAVDVVSEEEMGATFTLRLPVSYSREEAPAEVTS